MAVEFSEMLQDTLRKMQERIELTPAPYTTDDNAHVPLKL